MAIEFSLDKLKKLVHYVCFKVDNPANLGAVKLNKILWFSDVLAYMNWAQAITGETYIKRQLGPMPQHIFAALDELEEEDMLRVRNVDFYGFAKKEFLVLEDPDYSDFSTEQVRLVDDIIDKVCNEHTARSISELSHNSIWDMAAIGEPIPYSSMFVGRLGEIDENDMEWAKTEVAKRV